MKQEFVDQIAQMANKQLDGVHTAFPATIVSYDVGKQLAVVQPKIKYRKPDGSLMDLSPCNDVPVCFPQSPSAEITVAWPIKAGDGCLVVCSEEALDYWRTGSETDTELRFDLTSAIAYVGLNNKPDAAMKVANNEECAIIRNGPDTYVKVKKGRVDIKGDVYIDGNVYVTKKVISSDEVIANNTICLAHHKHTETQAVTTTPIPTCSGTTEALPSIG